MKIFVKRQIKFEKISRSLKKTREKTIFMFIFWIFAIHFSRRLNSCRFFKMICIHSRLTLHYLFIFISFSFSNNSFSSAPSQYIFASSYFSLFSSLSYLSLLLSILHFHLSLKILNINAIFLILAFAYTIPVNPIKKNWLISD